MRLGPIPAKSGEVLVRKRFSDAEGLTLASGTPEQGTALISFERKHRIGRFAIDKGVLSPPLDFIELPAGAKKMKSNKGLEAIAIMRAGPNRGALVVFAEHLPMRRAIIRAGCGLGGSRSKSISPIPVTTM